MLFRNEQRNSEEGLQFTRMRLVMIPATKLTIFIGQQDSGTQFSRKGAKPPSIFALFAPLRASTMSLTTTEIHQSQERLRCVLLSIGAIAEMALLPNNPNPNRYVFPNRDAL